MITEKTGDIFTSTADAIGHGTNCMGIAGAGIAKEIHNRFPGWYEEYIEYCENSAWTPGTADAHVNTSWNYVIFDIYSQHTPGPDARRVSIFTGVLHALQMCYDRGLKTLALPQIGCGIGGLDWKDVKQDIIKAHDLIQSFEMPVDVELWSLDD